MAKSVYYLIILRFLRNDSFDEASSGRHVGELKEIYST